MKWRDMAEVSRELHPDTAPQAGVCYRSDDERFTVARVDVEDPAKGWALWHVGGPTMRLVPSLTLTRASQGMALAELLSLAIRGVALVQRARGLARGVANLIGART